MQENHYLVPQQEEGHKQDLEHHIITEHTGDAEYMFVDAKDRLLEVNKWNKFCPSIHIEFRLTDHHGLGIGRHAHKGDYIRMGAAEATERFHWVSIEAIEYDDYPDLNMETFAMRVRKVHDPLHNKEDKKEYLLANSATYTFVIERRGAKLFASFHGRNGAGIDKNITDATWQELVRSFLGT